ncbi:glycosyltransferase family 2 protein [Dyadobacter sp. CY356]|uniref:glycosyltransferase family 2 protein n=1 Tax=Dyadobacter sp. CY356 TaxID=2906442 RepID=UPI001F2F9C75|nr:glycosyltransferase family 2 protein [Dyadobacter sp. CY356]MCF0055160.1 glycosyltransferase [Dyadobacter sp. CY356]
MSHLQSKPLLVTIITIVYNGEKYLEDTILSVLSQSYKNIEYIIVDGGSNDRTLNIVKKYENDISKFISEKDQGISDAFNKGIKLASGDLIGMINADDWYEENAVELIVNNYSATNEIICGNVKLFKNEHTFKSKKSSLKNIEKEMSIWHPGMFCPKSIYDTIGGYDLHYKILMDYDFVLRAYNAGTPFKFIESDVANMRYGGVSNQLITKSMKESLLIKNKYFGVTIRHYFEFVYFQLYYNTIINLKNLIYRQS